MVNNGSRKQARRAQQVYWLLLSIVFVSLFGAALQTYRHSRELVRQAALTEAEHYSGALKAFRTLYTSSVVKKAREYGMDITHDHAGNPGAIPLPATLTSDLGRLMAEGRQEVSIRLYSDYPFPWRKDGGPADGFEERALQQLQIDPDTPYYEFESGSVLRYATADVLRPDCVDCHNTHPDTPKNDWKVGDVRGVLATSTPLHQLSADSPSALTLTPTFVGLALAGIFAVLLSIWNGKRHKEVADRLAKATHETILAATQNILAGTEAKIARKEAVEANRVKAEFLANMSHEIRTPMNGVLNMTDFLLDTDLNEDQADLACTIRESGRHLLHIVNDILHFSKIEAGKIQIESIPFDPRTLVANLHALL